MSRRISPNDPPDARPENYWDGRGKRLGDATFGRTAAATPMGGGEYLPPLEEDEVEVVMIGMESTNGDVISVRARPEGDRILYRVVDEQELGYGADGPTVYTFQPTSSDQPLSNGELTELLWSLEHDGWRVFVSQWEQDAESGDLPEQMDGFFSLSSDFYEGLDDWLEEMFLVWRQEHDGGDESSAPEPAPTANIDDEDELKNEDQLILARNLKWSAKNLAARMPKTPSADSATQNVVAVDPRPLVPELLDILRKNPRLVSAKNQGGFAGRMRRLWINVPLTLTIREQFKSQGIDSAAVGFGSDPRMYACEIAEAESIWQVVDGDFLVTQAGCDQDMQSRMGELEARVRELMCSKAGQALEVEQRDKIMDALISIAGRRLMDEGKSPRSAHDCMPLGECPVCGKHLHAYGTEWCVDPKCDLSPHCQHVVLTGKIEGVDEQTPEWHIDGVEELATDLVGCVAGIQDLLESGDREPAFPEDCVGAVAEAATERLKSVFPTTVGQFYDPDWDEYTENLLSQAAGMAGGSGVDFDSGMFGQYWDVYFSHAPETTQASVAEMLKQDIRIAHEIRSMLER